MVLRWWLAGVSDGRSSAWYQEGKSTSDGKNLLVEQNNTLYKFPDSRFYDLQETANDQTFQKGNFDCCHMEACLALARLRRLELMEKQPPITHAVAGLFLATPPLTPKLLSTMKVAFVLSTLFVGASAFGMLDDE